MMFSKWMLDSFNEWKILNDLNSLILLMAQFRNVGNFLDAIRFDHRGTAWGILSKTVLGYRKTKYNLVRTQGFIAGPKDNLIKHIRGI